jgi:hypothetical protein
LKTKKKADKKKKKDDSDEEEVEKKVQVRKIPAKKTTRRSRSRDTH